MKQIIVCVIVMVFVSVCHATSHYIARDELQKKWENQRLSHDVGRNNEDEESREDLFYNLLLEEFLDTEMEPEIEEEEMLKDELDLEALREIEDLEDAIVQTDGDWLDDTIDLEEDLPPNYHNATEMRTNVGENKVNVKETVDKTTSEDGNLITVTENIESEPMKELELFSCSLSQPCTENEYCLETEFTSVCLTCQVLGSGCVDDAQCCTSDDSIPLCVKGYCKAGVEMGTEGTICDTSDDCQNGLCCAEVLDFPRRLCRRFARLNERCSPNGDDTEAIGIVYKPTYFCPCQNGLSCETKSDLPNALSQYKYLQKHVCALNERDIFGFDQDETPNFINSDAPTSDERIANLFTRLWQARAETEEDQRFLNPPSPQVHHGMKESLKREAENPSAM